MGSAEVKLRSPAIYLVIAVHGRGGRFAAVDLEEPVHDQVLLSERRPRQRDVPLSQRRTPAVEAELRAPSTVCMPCTSVLSGAVAMSLISAGQSAAIV